MKETVEINENEKKETIIEELSQHLSLVKNVAWRDEWYRTQKKQKEEKDN